MIIKVGEGLDYEGLTLGKWIKIQEGKKKIQEEFQV